MNYIILVLFLDQAHLVSVFRAYNNIPYYYYYYYLISIV